jgi:hypothetical protein
MSNYIPHFATNNIDRELWHNSYINQLINLNNITREIINKNYPKKKIIWDNSTFNAFSKLIFHSSSKYIYDFDLINKDNLKYRN